MSDTPYLARRLALRAAVPIVLLTAVSCGDGAAGAGQESAEEAHVESGADALVLDSTAIAVAGIRIGSIESVQTSGLAVTGTITYDANRVSHIGSRTDGRIVALRADIGQPVGGGQALAILESPEIGQIRAEAREAAELLDIARENYAREQRLEQQGISSRKELLDAEADLRRAEAAVRSAQERLRVLGAGSGTGGQFAVTAPFPGVIVARDASLGEMATPSDQLFTVADLSEVWIELDVFERDLTRVAVGQAVMVRTAAYPGRSFPGRIVYLGAVLEPETRTVDARVEIPNSGGALKPGMFANAVIQVGGGGAATLVVPQDAVQELEGRTVVFVIGARPGEFRAVPVEVGEAIEGDRVVITSGLSANQRIVVAGAFALRSELSEGEIAEDEH